MERFAGLRDPAQPGQDVATQGNRLTVAAAKAPRVMQSFQRQFAFTRLPAGLRELDVTNPERRSFRRAGDRGAAPAGRRHPLPHAAACGTAQWPGCGMPGRNWDRGRWPPGSLFRRAGQSQSNIDAGVLPVAGGRPIFFSLEYSSQLAGQPLPPGQLMRYDTAAGYVYASGLNAPSSMAVDGAARVVYITDRIDGTVLAVPIV